MQIKHPHFLIFGNTEATITLPKQLQKIGVIWKALAVSSFIFFCFCQPTNHLDREIKYHFFLFLTSVGRFLCSLMTSNKLYSFWPFCPSILRCGRSQTRRVQPQSPSVKQMFHFPQSPYIPFRLISFTARCEEQLCLLSS